jgi:hypothetical protein
MSTFSGEVHIVHPPAEGTLALAVLAALEGHCGSWPPVICGGAAIPAGAGAGACEVLTLHMPRQPRP